MPQHGLRDRTAPRADRPVLPKDYGVPATEEGMLPWSWPSERLASARNYWVSTTRPDGRPHATPIWAVWLDETFYMDGSPETRRGRNIAANPAVVVHLESGAEVVILEGVAETVGRPERSFAERLAAAYAEKYAKDGYSPSPDTWDNGGLWRVRPRVVLAWSEFPKTMTRWRFD